MNDFVHWPTTRRDGHLVGAFAPRFGTHIGLHDDVRSALRCRRMQDRSPTLGSRVRRRLGRPTFVFSRGKTGTSALAKTLRSNTISPVIQCHRATKLGIAKAQQWRSAEGAIHVEQRVDAGGARLRREVAFRRWGQFAMFSAYRDPVETLIATFFENLVEHGHVRSTSARPDVDQLRAEFLPFVGRWNENFGDWFEEELRPITDLDVYASPFPADVGYVLLENRRFRLVVARTDRLAHCGSEAVSVLLGRRLSTGLLGANVGADKWYAPAYEEFVRGASLPGELVDREYAARAAVHFFTSDEIAERKKRWTG